jgi:hypothetical protein
MKLINISILLFSNHNDNGCNWELRTLPGAALYRKPQIPSLLWSGFQNITPVNYNPRKLYILIPISQTYVAQWKLAGFFAPTSIKIER